MKILTIIGTRPEAIKMALLVKALNTTPGIEHKLCVTGQHREMLDSVLSFFEIQPDFDLDIMRSGQDLTDITTQVLQGLRDLFNGHFRPDMVLVHGDTTTCMAASLAAFYHRIKIGHVEAGLRTGNLSAPYPEEANRIIADVLADLHFAPTKASKANLVRNGIDETKVHVTGNTVIDSLFFATRKVKKFSSAVPLQLQDQYTNKRIILVTGHRRENFGNGFLEICRALKEIATGYPEIAIHYPVHLNPNVRKPVFEILGSLDNVYLSEPMDYPDFVHAMDRSWLILTDSGGVQEEAPALGKPVLVMRNTTERPEVLEAGWVRLVGADAETIMDGIKEYMFSNAQVNTANPFGDGYACGRIVRIIQNSFKWGSA